MNNTSNNTLNNILNKINKLFDYKLLINNNDGYNLLKKFHSIIFLIITVTNNELVLNRKYPKWGKKRNDWYKNCIDIVEKKNYNELSKIIESGNEIYKEISDEIYKKIPDETRNGVSTKVFYNEYIKNKFIKISELFEKVPTFLEVKNIMLNQMSYIIINCYTNGDEIYDTINICYLNYVLLIYKLFDGYYDFGIYTRCLRALNKLNILIENDKIKYSSMEENKSYDDLIKQYNIEFIIFNIIRYDNDNDFIKFKKFYNDLQKMSHDHKIYVLNVCFDIYEKSYEKDVKHFEDNNKSISESIQHNINNIKNKFENMNIEKIHNLDELIINKCKYYYKCLKTAKKIDMNNDNFINFIKSTNELYNII